MTFSPRIHRYIQPMCVDRRGCLMGFYLCRPDFYRRMAPEIPRRAPLSERLEAWGKTAYIKTGKDVKRRLRALRSVG
jgi:hypothetical protein